MNREVTIGNRKVGDGHPAFIIAEIGINHNGSLDFAKQMILAAHQAGVDAVKFQKRTPELCVPEHQRSQMRETPWGYISYLEYRYKVEFGLEEYQEIDRYCKELGIAFVAYSPLGRGFLTGQIKKFEDFAQDDYRRLSPRFQGENFQKNLDLAQKLESLAVKKGCTASQLALAWTMAKYDHIFPIPGTKRIKYLEENAGAVNVSFSAEELAAIDNIAPKGIASGTRYPEAMMSFVNQ